MESEEETPKHQKLAATPAMLAQRMAALEKIRNLNPYGHITDPVAWQREIREDRPYLVLALMAMLPSPCQYKIGTREL